MNMTALFVDHSTYIVVAGDHVANGIAIEQFQVLVAVALPESLLCLQMVHLLRGKCGKNTAILQVALNTVTRHAITNDAAALKRHLADQLGFFDRHTVFYGIDVAAVTVDDLPAITP